MSVCVCVYVMCFSVLYCISLRCRSHSLSQIQVIIQTFHLLWLLFLLLRFSVECLLVLLSVLFFFSLHYNIFIGYDINEIDLVIQFHNNRKNHSFFVALAYCLFDTVRWFFIGCSTYYDSFWRGKLDENQ